MPTFVDGEAALSVFGKLNNAITRTDWCVVVADVSELANLTYSAGSAFTVSTGTQVVTAREGFSYEVLASGASTFDVQSGTVKLEALPTAAGHYNFDCMLPAGDGTTDDYAKLRKLLDKVESTIADVRYIGAYNIFIPGKRYYLSQTLELKQTVRLFGTGGSYPSSVASTLIFPTNTTGIVINRFNTNEAGATSTTTAADWTTIEGLQIASLGGTGLTHPGILMRSRATIRSCVINGFPGNGISVIAGAGVGGASEGNANLFCIDTVSCSQNHGWGFYAEGADANAGNIYGLDCSSNGRGGVWDSSFLGNTYYGCHVASNGIANSGANGTTKSAMVWYSGSRYVAHWTATEAELVATTPGTDPDVWIFDETIGTHPTIPTWVSGQPSGTYFVGFSYYSDGLSSRNLFINCYSEGGAPGNVMLGSSGFLSGLLHRNYAGGKLSIAGGGTGWTAQSFSSGDGTLAVSTTDGSGYLTLTGAGGLDDVWRLKSDASGLLLDNRNLGGRQPLRVTGAPHRAPYTFSVPSILINGTLQTAATAAPTTGTWARGDYVRNSNPAVGSPKGWFCTVAGTPGTWVSEGNL